ncbi:TIGR02281 family clan AA aspartic protease [Rhodobacteraceae bacterium CCMM004]|nr:TIGR02281 family clan AA aspartic protease [Rhodobacteraceae bacterium CCMM004]
MDGQGIGQLAYLGLLGAALVGYMVVSHRGQLGKMAQNAALWALIFVGVIAVVGLWPGVRDQVAPRQSFVGEGRIEVPQSFDGHYRMVLDIEGTPVTFIVDTGASDMVLSRSDAQRAGLRPETLAYTHQAQTANGRVPIARVVLDEVRLGGLADRNVPASVNGGEMDVSLLGMSYLSQFGRLEIEGGRLTLIR